MRVGVDTGGTFTDLVGDDGRVVKVPSTPDDPTRAVQSALDDAGVGVSVDLLAHGTTVATNALLEGRGREIEALDPASIPAIPAGVDAVAVCLLHADLDPAHEQVVAKELVGRGLDVSCSHEVSPEFREYERAVTTVINAVLRPACRDYLLGVDL